MKKFSLPHLLSLIIFEIPFYNIKKIQSPMMLLLVSCIHLLLCREGTSRCITCIGHSRVGLEGEKDKINKAKDVKDMAACLLNDSYSIIHMIFCNCKELSQMVEKGDFGIVVIKDLIEKNLAEMIPMLHTEG